MKKNKENVNVNSNSIKNDSSAEMKYSSLTHLSYSLGGFFDNFLTAAFTIRVIGFYEDELLVPIILIGVAFFFYGIWNMVNDPLAGFLSDKTTRFTKKWGRRFPWFLFSAFPLAIVYFLIFAVPFTGEFVIFFWLLITICIFDLFFSFWMTNWLALYPDKFRSHKERTKVGGITTILGLLGMAFGMLLPPLFITYGVKESYIYAALLVTMIGLISAFLMVPGMREDQELRERALKVVESREMELSFFKTMKFALKQKNFIVYLVAYLATIILMVFMLSSVYFMVRYILKMPAEVEIYVLATFLLGVLISVPLWVRLSRSLGNRKMYIWGCGLTAIALIPFLLISSLVLVMIFAFLLGVSASALWTLMYPTFSDVIDEVVEKTGKRQEGTYFGIRTFIGRLSIVLQAIVFAVVHELTNYVPGAETQTPSAIWGIRIIMALIPMVFFIIAFFLMLKVYDLSLDRVKETQNKLMRLKI
jgi:GPH family glycoside/pentoside/hexuronide:cation symporter